MTQATFSIWRGDSSGGRLEDYQTEVSEGMVVLDAIHQIQAESANDLAVRWNCKAGKCGSCSTVTGLSRSRSEIRVMQASRGRPLISVEHEREGNEEEVEFQIRWTND